MKKLIDLISSRFFVFVFAVLRQVIWLLLISWGMSSLSAPVTMTADILSILLVLWIVNKEINPSYKLVDYFDFSTAGIWNGCILVIWRVKSCKKDDRRVRCSCTGN